MPETTKILIVDDAPSMRSVLKGALLNAGFVNFSEADSGQAAINLLEQDKFQLIICDMDMPKGNGLEVLREVRCKEEIADTPFIMVSAISEAQKVVKIIEEGVDDYIIKPIKPEAFARRVKGVLKEIVAKN